MSDSLERYNKLIEARRKVYRYNGNNSFVVKMQKKAFQDRNWLPSNKQAKTIFKILEKEIGRL